MNFKDLKHFVFNGFSFIQYLMYLGCKKTYNAKTINELSLQICHKNVN
jgi:hypothetical protein